MNLTAADKRSSRTFDRAVELWEEIGPDHEAVRQRLSIEGEKLRGKRGQDYDLAVSVPLLERWWSEGLERQVGQTSIPLRVAGHQVTADRKRKRLEEMAGGKLQVFELATTHLKKSPGQFDTVAAALRKPEAKIADPPTVETLLAWWQNGLWVGTDQVRPPISDVVANHLALYEQQADALASTFRRENKHATGHGGLLALDVLALEQRNIRDVRITMAGSQGKIGLDRVALALMTSLAEDLAEPGRFTPDRKYEWINRIAKLQQQLMQREQVAILAQNTLGNPARSMVLGISSIGSSQDQPTVPLDASSAAEMAQRARELAENMDAADRLPAALDQALEAEVSREGA